MLELNLICFARVLTWIGARPVQEPYVSYFVLTITKTNTSTIIQKKTKS